MVPSLRHRVQLALRGRWRGIVLVVTAASVVAYDAAARIQSGRRAARVAAARVVADEFHRRDVIGAETAAARFVTQLSPFVTEADLKSFKPDAPASRPDSPTRGLSIRLASLRVELESLGRARAALRAATQPADAAESDFTLSRLDEALAARVQRDAALTAARKSLSDADARCAALMARFTSAHPEVRLALSDRAAALRAWAAGLDELDRRLAREIVEISSQHVAAVRADSDFESRTATLARLVPVHGDLCRARNEARARHATLQRVAADAARPSSIETAWSLAAAACAAAMACILSTLFAMYLDRRRVFIRSARDARRRLGLPVWADVPRCAAPPLARVEQ